MVRHLKNVYLFLGLILMLFVAGCINNNSSNIEKVKEELPKTKEEVKKVQTFDAIAVWQTKSKIDRDWNIYYSLYDKDSDKWFTYESPRREALISDVEGDEVDVDVYSYANEGIAIAVWSNKKEGDIYFSIFNGRKWSPPTPITFPGNDRDPTVAIGENYILIAWINDEKGRLYYILFNYRDVIKGKQINVAPKYIDVGYDVSLPEAEVYRGDLFGLIFIMNSKNPIAVFSLISPNSSSYMVIPSQKYSATFDSNNPTLSRTGISYSNGKLVFSWRTKGGIYSSYYDGKLGNASFVGVGFSPDVVLNGRETHVFSVKGQDKIFDSSRSLFIDIPNAKDRRVSITSFSGYELIVFYSQKNEQLIAYSLYSPQTKKWARPKAVSFLFNSVNPAVAPWVKEEGVVDSKEERGYCGNAILEGNEQCEAGIPCSTGLCNLDDCTCYKPPAFCGDGVLQGNEQCETGIACANPTQSCDLKSCSCVDDLPPAVCGNAILEGNEQCEAGIPCTDPLFSCDTNSCQCFAVSLPGGPGNDSVDGGEKEPKPNNNTVVNISNGSVIDEGDPLEDIVLCSDSFYENLSSYEENGMYCIDDCPEGYFCSESCTCEEIEDQEEPPKEKEEKYSLSCSSSKWLPNSLIISLNPESFVCEDDCPEGYSCNEFCECEKEEKTRLSCSDPFSSLAFSLNWLGGLSLRGGDGSSSLYCEDDCPEGYSCNEFCECVKEESLPKLKCSEEIIDYPEFSPLLREKWSSLFGNSSSYCEDDCPEGYSCNEFCECVPSEKEEDVNETVNDSEEGEGLEVYCSMSDLYSEEEIVVGFCVDDCPEGYSCNEFCKCVPVDSDGDGVENEKDNCPSHYNPDQKDRDEDGIGDACDICPEDRENDKDGDGFCADEDNCPSVYNPNQEDEDEDGIGSHCDPIPVDCEREASNVVKDKDLLTNVDVVDEGFLNAQICAQRVNDMYDVLQCTLTCKYSFFKLYTWYSRDGIANTYACCYGSVKRLQCSDCPGQNPTCPQKSECNQYNPFINSR